MESYSDFVTFPCGILGQVWYLIVLIPDLCRLSYFYFFLRALGDKSSDVILRELEAIEHFKRADIDPNCDAEITCDDTEIYRTADGTCNNLDNPLWGSSGVQHLRLLTNAYRNGK